MRVLTVLTLAAFLQPPANPSSVAAIVADVATLSAAKTNDGRFEALTALLSAAGLTFIVEPFTIPAPMRQDPRTTGRNVIVSVGQGDREIVVGAHYDATWLLDGSLSRGAVDNGAAAVMLVAVAKGLRQEPPPARVTFVWFDMEESGVLGAGRYIRDHRTNRPAAMLNFDVNAYGDTLLYAPPPNRSDATLRPAVQQVCAELGIECLRFPQLPASDDRAFGLANIPALSFALLPAAEAHHFWLRLNAPAGSPLAPTTTPPIEQTIHTPNDLPEKASPPRETIETWGSRLRASGFRCCSTWAPALAGALRIRLKPDSTTVPRSSVEAAPTGEEQSR